jgi:hypothetical protein
MAMAIKRLAADIEYFEALARLYQATGDRELARLALSASRSVKRLLEGEIAAKRSSAHSRAVTRRLIKAA